ncbi:cupin [Candidatus Saccharibacteria bacterium]|nr:MAG: cupin [Candidatus Saccharibacteria bacterium]
MQPYVRRVEKPWGYELHFATPDMPYMMKLMHVNAGCRMSLQIHDAKRETYVILSGRAALVWEDNNGELLETELQLGQGYSTIVGQKHRFKGITDADIMEASTPEIGTTWRLEDDYSRPNETPEQRKAERGE